MYRLFVLAIAGILSTGASAQPASGTFKVATVVPEFCQLTASDLAVTDESGILRGQVLEMCNGSSGYRIVAFHRHLDEQEDVAFRFAGVTKSLRSNGISEIATQTGARYGVRDVDVEYDALRSPFSITLAITAY